MAAEDGFDPNYLGSKKENKGSEPKTYFTYDSHTVGKETDVVGRVNQDDHFVDVELGAFGMFDGVSGDQDGHLGSETAKQATHDWLKKTVGSDDSQDGTERNLRLALISAKNKIHDLVEKKRQELEDQYKDLPIPLSAEDLARYKIASTALVGKVIGPDQERMLVLANLGDTRAYLFRNGQLTQLTIDDNPVLRDHCGNNKEEMRRIQSLLNEANDARELSKDIQMLFYYREKVDRYLTEGLIEPTYYNSDIKPGDQLLVCTDGISDNFSQSELEEMMSRQGLTSHDLVAAAIDRSHEGKKRSKKDDMTALIIRFDPDDNQQEANYGKVGSDQPSDAVKVDNEKEEIVGNPNILDIIKSDNELAQAYEVVFGYLNINPNVKTLDPDKRNTYQLPKSWVEYLSAWQKLIALSIKYPNLELRVKFTPDELLDEAQREENSKAWKIAELYETIQKIVKAVEEGRLNRESLFTEMQKSHSRPIRYALKHYSVHELETILKINSNSGPSEETDTTQHSRVDRIRRGEYPTWRDLKIILAAVGLTEDVNQVIQVEGRSFTLGELEKSVRDAQNDWENAITDAKRSKEGTINKAVYEAIEAKLVGGEKVRQVFAEYAHDRYKEEGLRLIRTVVTEGPSVAAETIRGVKSLLHGRRR